MIIYIFLIIIFIFLAAFFSGTETALITADKIKLQTLSDNKQKSATVALKIFNNPEQMVATMLTGTNISLIASAAVATAFAKKYYPSLPKFYLSLIMTTITLIFGEIFPKVLCRKLSIFIVLKFSLLLKWIITLFSPIVFVLTSFTNTIIKTFRLKQTIRNPYITRDEMQLYFREGERKGIIDKKERELIYGIFDFGSVYAREIMIPLVDIIMIERKSKVKDVVRLLKKTGYSKIPVFDGRVDNIIGYINIYDLFKTVPNTPIEKFIKSAYYIPETKRINELFNEMEKNNISIVFVVDEFGGTSGAITSQNIAEEIVGKLKDFHQSEEELMISKINKNEFLVNAIINIDELNEQLGLNIVKKGFETLAGFITYYLDKIPDKGEKFNYQNYEFEIQSATEKNVTSVIIRKK